MRLCLKKKKREEYEKKNYVAGSGKRKNLFENNKKRGKQEKNIRLIK